MWTRFIRRSFWLLLAAALATTAFARSGTQTLAQQSKLLRSVLDATAKLGAARKPVGVAFDIDDTLLLTAPRTKAILLEFAGKQTARYPDLAKQVSSLDPNKMPHGIAQVIGALGITDQELATEIKKYWLPRFLSNDYLTYDWPLPGALDFVGQLHKSGASIYYITARSPDKMRDGTEKALRHFGFPLDAHAKVMMNDGHKSAPAFKAKLTSDLAKTQVLTGLFENEPDNLNAMHHADPAAQAIFLDTVHTPVAGPLESGIPAVKDFRIGDR